MSVQSEITRISENVDDALEAVAEYGVDTTGANSDNLGAKIRAIPKANIVQSTGESTTDIMSQKAVTDALISKIQLAPEYAESLEELEVSGDKSKMYVLPDGFIYAWMLTRKEVPTGPTYNNLLDDAINADGTPYVVTNSDGTTTVGYKKGWRINSSVQEKESAGNCVTGYIPVRAGQTIRVKNITLSGTNNGYFHWYDNRFSVVVAAYYENYSGNGYNTKPDSNGLIQFNAPGEASLYYFRMTTGVITDETIITADEKITEGGGGTEVVEEWAWASTGRAFVPADYEDRIIDLESLTAEHTADIANLKNGITSSTPIKDWDAPIYDANIPVFQLSAEKAAMTNATNTPANIYAMYDALMAKHPKYITKTDLGLCSDGVNHVYRYDFREPDPHYESGKDWSETKTKAIIVTGIHFEWAGIYGMFNALEEIAENPALRNFRRNTHLIVVPVANPYATIANNYQSGLSTPNSYGVRNANGVEIHRNFEVDWILNAEGDTHYGGPAPLSEVETQYIDNILKNNTDAAVFLSCHNCGVDTFWGTGFIWSSTATKYMTNMGFRLVGKLSDAWMDKYGDILSAGIAEYKTDELEDGDTRLGWAGLSTSPGTEAKQATKYGIQGTNVEICNPFQIHGTKSNPEPSMSAFTMSRGAEVYVNFLLTAFGCYDYNDKKDYAPNLPWED